MVIKGVLGTLSAARIGGGGGLRSGSDTVTAPAIGTHPPLPPAESCGGPAGRLRSQRHF